jgi:hypothetical protein
VSTYLVQTAAFQLFPYSFFLYFKFYICEGEQEYNRRPSICFVVKIGAFPLQHSTQANKGFEATYKHASKNPVRAYKGAKKYL